MTTGPDHHVPIRAGGEVVADLLPRIAALAERARDLKSAYALAMETRNELVVEAVDAGIKHEAIGRAAGVNRTRVIRICAGSQSAADELL